MARRNKPDLDSAFAKIEKSVRDARFSAMNQVGRDLRDRLIELAAEKMNVDPEVLRVNRAGNKRKKIYFRLKTAYELSPVLRINVSQHGVPLIVFEGRWQRSDVGASYRAASGGRSFIPGSFIAKYNKNNGFKTIYKRKTEKSHPIKSMTTLGIYLVSSQPEIQRALREYFRNQFPRELRKEYSFRSKR